MSIASRLITAFIVVALGQSSVVAGDLDKLDRAIAKEPAYQGKPKYGLLVFDRAGKERVWLVQDGSTLYVDRQGNGDLTDPKNKVAAKKNEEGGGDAELTFEVGDVTVGGRTHKELKVYLTPLKSYADSSLGKLPETKAALVKNPDAMVASLSLDVEVPGMKGGGSGGRVLFIAGPRDLAGLLRFADAPAKAPVIHLGGPLHVTFRTEGPKMRIGRDADVIVVVGTRGIGPGTLAVIGYEDTIPTSANPTAEVTFKPAKDGDAPIKKKLELKERC